MSLLKPLRRIGPPFTPVNTSASAPRWYSSVWPAGGGPPVVTEVFRRLAR